mmetsp:Transcript_30477/g.49303  ORF Transcript_30477/g.49303 Transcript_30477/m.49303 type:complete len:193 (-) Transcript_30477:142-720(-)
MLVKNGGRDHCLLMEKCNNARLIDLRQRWFDSIKGIPTPKMKLQDFQRYIFCTGGVPSALMYKPCTCGDWFTDETRRFHGTCVWCAHCRLYKQVGHDCFAIQAMIQAKDAKEQRYRRMDMPYVGEGENDPVDPRMEHAYAFDIETMLIDGIHYPYAIEDHHILTPEIVAFSKSIDEYPKYRSRLQDILCSEH